MQSTPSPRRPCPTAFTPPPERRAGAMETPARSRLHEVGHLIRPYRPADRAAVRAICADTGFLGQPIDPVFEDRELFADYLTSYYTDAEPESTFVCELEGEVMGYVMGSRFPKRKAGFEVRMLPGLVARGLWRYCHAALQRGQPPICALDSSPRRARRIPSRRPTSRTFHFNVRPKARNVATTVAMVDMFLQISARARRKAGLCPGRHVRNAPRRADVRALRLSGHRRTRGDEVSRRSIRARSISSRSSRT